MNSAQSLVYEAIDEINLDSSMDIKIEKNADFLLLDDQSSIDSLTLVNLFVGIEALLELRLRKTISIVNEESFQSDAYPFKSVGNLINYVDTLIQ